MSSYYTEEEALAVAAHFNLDKHVKYLMEHGYTPDEALREFEDQINNNEY